ncbi:MAG: LOG family protein [Lentisphaeria bacterium]
MEQKPSLKAYEDIEFLKSDPCRPTRLQLEYLKPEVTMTECKVNSTIVVFGSARIPDPETAAKELERAEKNAADRPDDKQLQFDLRHARHMKEQSCYYQKARDFARIVSECSSNSENSEFVIMTGGGGGIMEAANRGADDAGARSVGLNISIPFEQLENPYITDGLGFQFHYFSIRKMHFLKRAKALCAFPGGFGTMDELFETLTLTQTRKVKPIPVVLFGEEFWRGTINWEQFVDRGLISPDDMNIIRFCEDPQEAWDYIREFWKR